MAPSDDLWIFGYGSLVWRPAFPHQECRPGFVLGWARRFWQGSTDHRGVPEAPGRVATLVQEDGAVCWGMGYRVAPEHCDEVLAGLDHRERGGFERHRVEIRFRAPQLAEPAARALVYIAGERNANYLGPAPLEAVASQIQRAHGPSGSNLEYLLRLDQCLRAHQAEDEHVSALVRLVRSRG